MMFGLRSLFVFLLVVSVAVATDYLFHGTFDDAKTKTSGRFYYLYSEDGYDHCRFREEYDLPGNKHVNNLYMYMSGSVQSLTVLYSMCDVCTSDFIPEMPDQWWKNSTSYTDSNISEKVVIGSKSYTLKWYNKTSGTAKSSQVKSILMNYATDPAEAVVGAIEFTDGRFFRIKEFNYVENASMYDSKFSPDDTCPTGGCTMLVDIALIFDFNGSMYSGDWNYTTQFVENWVDVFNFGDQAAAAVIIKSYSDASIIAGAGSSLSTNKEDLIRDLKKQPPPSGSSCLGSGLELARSVFDKSPRKSKSPTKLAIVISDGSDSCNDRSQAAAELIKQDGAALIVIGVNVSGSVETHLKNLATKIIIKYAFFKAKSFKNIDNVANSLFTYLNCNAIRPVCDTFYGCGKCFPKPSTNPSTTEPSASCYHGAQISLIIVALITMLSVLFM